MSEEDQPRSPAERSSGRLSPVRVEGERSVEAPPDEHLPEATPAAEGETVNDEGDHVESAGDQEITTGVTEEPDLFAAEELEIDGTRGTDDNVRPIALNELTEDGQHTPAMGVDEAGTGPEVQGTAEGDATALHTQDHGQVDTAIGENLTGVVSETQGTVEGDVIDIDTQSIDQSEVSVNEAVNSHDSDLVEGALGSKPVTESLPVLQMAEVLSADSSNGNDAVEHAIVVTPPTDVAEAASTHTDVQQDSIIAVHASPSSDHHGDAPALAATAESEIAASGQFEVVETGTDQVSPSEKAQTISDPLPVDDAVEDSDTAEQKATSPAGSPQGDTAKVESPTITATATPREQTAEPQPASPIKTVEQSQPAVPDVLAAKQIALLLKINKELIRLCVDLQAKNLAAEPVFRESATRLQTNLAFLASLAEPAKEGATESPAKPSVQLNHEPFPSTSHAPESLLPKLYAHLRSVTLSGASGLHPSPNSLGKRRRDSAEDLSPPKVPRSRTPAEQQAVAHKPSPQPMDRRRSSTNNSISAVPAPYTASPLSATSTLANVHAVNGNATATATSSSRASTPINAEFMARTMASPTTTNVAALAAANSVTDAGSPANGVRPNGAGGPTPQQVQGLIQAFGQNAVNNLNALQAHYRSGQPQQNVAYMEANVPNFRTLPLQIQLQQMANFQNAALQRQRQMSIGSASSPGGGGPATLQQQQQQQQRPAAQQRRPSAAPSPAPMNVDQMRRDTQSPIAAPGTPFQPPQAPGTPAAMAFANLASPSAASAASPGAFGQMQPQQNLGFPVQQQPGQQQAQMQQIMASLPNSLASMPPHLQQQLLQHFMQQSQQPQPHVGGGQSMAPPPPGGLNPMMLAMLQQQHANAPMHMSQVGFRPNMAQPGWPNGQQQQQPPSGS